jgi:hypothetical protein
MGEKSDYPHFIKRNGGFFVSQRHKEGMEKGGEGFCSVGDEERGEFNKYPVDRASQVLMPAEISMTTGKHQLFLQRQLYEPYKDSVVLEKDQTKILNIRLSPEREE